MGGEDICGAIYDSLNSRAAQMFADEVFDFIQRVEPSGYKEMVRETEALKFQVEDLTEELETLRSEIADKESERES